MSPKEIVFVIVMVSPFIVGIYKTMTLDPGRKPKVWPVYLRISIIAAGIGLLALAWIIAPESSMVSKILLTVYTIYFIYRSLEGWLFKSKGSLPPSSSQSPE